MQKIFIIDASGYLYSSYFAIRNMTNSKGESTNALYGFIRAMLKLIKDFHPTHIVSIFDGPRNGMKRELIYPEYKAHRSEAPQDLYYQISWAQKFCDLIGIPFLNIPEVEADDTMGCIAKWAENGGSEVFLCTSDKDMCQLVNEKIHLLNTRKDNLIIGPAQVQEIHGVPPSKIVDLFAMIGDASDNIPGLPGIGPKTAITLLNQFDTLDNMLANMDQIPNPKKRESIIANIEKAILSKRLVEIDFSVEIPHDAQFYHIKSPKIGDLKSFYSEMNFNSLVKELELYTQGTLNFDRPIQKETREPYEKLSYILVDDEIGLNELIETLRKQKEISLNVEMTHLQPIKADLVGISFSTAPHHAWYVPANGALGLTRVLEALKPIFENPATGFYGHNIKSAYHLLVNYQINIANICFDILIASYLLNSHNRQHSLDYLAVQYFSKTRSSIADLTGKGKKAIDILDIPLENMSLHACEAADLICRLKTILESQLQTRHLTKLMNEIDLPLLKVLARMERHGIFLDVPCLKHQAHQVEEQIQHLAQEIYNHAGEVFNINSTQQLSHILQSNLHIALPKKTATGYSTNADILEELRDQHPIFDVILEYRTLEKLRSTYLENLINEIHTKTHRIHCTFNQSVTATGRLSCQDPNLQNIPVRSEVGRKIREAFRPEKPEWMYLAADYSQVELRLLAHFSEDPCLIQAFNNHEDIHSSTAASIFNVPLAEVTKEQRHKAKAVNFGLIYGQQAFGLAKELRIDVKEAATIIDLYFKRYPRVKQYLEYCKELARSTGKAVSISGRERLIPEIHSRNGQLRMLAERLAVNTPIQGAQADLIKLAMLAIDKKLNETKLKGYMILQIHDELIFEIPKEEIQIFEQIVRESMENVFKLKIPLIVDISIGKNWKEC